MFAFKTIEPYVWNQAIFEAPGYDMLSLADESRRQGSWVLETTEITDQFKSDAIEIELGKFAARIIEATEVAKLANYEANPGIAYKALDGSTLELNFFPPTEPYDGQYRLNGEPISLENWPMLDSPSVQQADGDSVLYLSHEDEKTPIRFR